MNGQFKIDGDMGEMLSSWAKKSWMLKERTKVTHVSALLNCTTSSRGAPKIILFYEYLVRSSEFCVYIAMRGIFSY